MSAAQSGTGDRGDRDRRAASFQEGAEDYDRLRPGYPAELWSLLIEDVRTAAGPGTGERPLRAVDVGAGTGRATLPLAAAGLEVLAVDPSAAMLERLRANAEHAGVSARVAPRESALEDLDPAVDGGADLIVLAQSLHWTDPATRWRRLHGLLAPAGVAAMLWNGWHLDPARHDVDAVADLFERVSAGLERPMTPDVERREPDGSAWTTGVVVEGPGAGLLRESRREVAEWTWELPTPTYIELLGTTSQYRVAQPAVRAELETGLARILGETVLLDAQTLLVEAVRA
ncbi:class I SAM-dependent methyltransferase [Actinomyces radicidentis]|uniref:class I SAM-dependent methyltransferase n=1 Tax=Actinomyces radicidentis TaxID=111015 RepID=UPI0028EB5AFE|nr:class I SAM-dependent methyltransferase [Actinomyces radicidentis]